MATKATTDVEVKEPVVKVAKKKATAVKAAKPAKEPKAVKETKEKEERYAYAVGRRKTAVAQVRIYPTSKPEGAIVNKKPIREYFGTPALEATALSPLKTSGLEESFRVTVVVRGGGLHGQADAIKLGIARALIIKDPALRPTLKVQGFLTRDARAVERKKPGLKKARRAPQWSKR